MLRYVATGITQCARYTCVCVSSDFVECFCSSVCFEWSHKTFAHRSPPTSSRLPVRCLLATPAVPHSYPKLLGLVTKPFCASLVSFLLRHCSFLNYERLPWSLLPRSPLPRAGTSRSTPCPSPPASGSLIFRLTLLYLKIHLM